MKTTDLVFDIRSTLVEVVKNEDEMIYFNSYSIIAEDKSGARLEHFHRFNEFTWVEDLEHEFLGYWKSVDALSDAQKLLNKIAAAEEINLQYWNSIEPVYGSAAYIREGREIENFFQEIIADEFY
jgi:hypothetical protein